MNEPQRVVIVGGGIAGLAAARRAAHLAPQAAITLLERDNRLGGKIVSERIGGFVVEGGPDSFLSSKPRGLDMCRELGVEDRLYGANPATRRTFVMQSGKLLPMPEGLSGLIPARLEPMLESDLFSEQGKQALQQEINAPVRPGTDDETLAAFISRRFGREVYDRLVEPLMAGIYAGDGSQLSLLATFPQLRKMEQEFGSLLAGAKHQTGSLASRPAFLTFPRGMQEMVEILIPALAGVDIRRGTAVRSVRRSGAFMVQTDDGALEADNLILATPAGVGAEILSGLDPDLSQQLAGITYASSATVSLAYPRDQVSHTLAGHGYIVPRIEGRPVIATTWTSSKFEHRAPDGYVLIRSFIGRAGQQEALTGSDQDLVEIARKEMREMLGITAAPIFHRLYRWPEAMPQYNLGHPERLARIQDLVTRYPGLALAGHAYGGVGIPDCIQSGERAAEAALLTSSLK